MKKNPHTHMTDAVEVPTGYVDGVEVVPAAAFDEVVARVHALEAEVVSANNRALFVASRVRELTEAGNAMANEILRGHYDVDKCNRVLVAWRAVSGSGEDTTDAATSASATLAASKQIVNDWREAEVLRAIRDLDPIEAMNVRTRLRWVPRSEHVHVPQVAGDPPTLTAAGIAFLASAGGEDTSNE